MWQFRRKLKYLGKFTKLTIMCRAWDPASATTMRQHGRLAALAQLVEQHNW